MNDDFSEMEEEEAEEDDSPVEDLEKEFELEAKDTASSEEGGGVVAGSSGEGGGVEEEVSVRTSLSLPGLGAAATGLMRRASVPGRRAATPYSSSSEEEAAPRWVQVLVQATTCRKSSP